MNRSERQVRRGRSISFFKLGFGFHHLVRIPPEHGIQPHELGVGANIGETDKPAPVLPNCGHQPVDIRGVGSEEFLSGDFECFGCDVASGEVFCGVATQHSDRTFAVLFVSASLFLANLRVGILGEYRKFRIGTAHGEIEDSFSREDDLPEVAIADDVFSRKRGVDVLVHALSVGFFCGFVQVAEWEGCDGQAVDAAHTVSAFVTEYTAYKEAGHPG